MVTLFNLTMAVVVWACGMNSWETDYMFELFPRPQFHHISLHDVKNLNTTYKNSLSALIYNVENAGDDGKYSVLRDFLHTFSTVKVLVQLSDEWMGSSKKWMYGEGVELFHLHPPLVLRQYGVFPYRESLKENVTKVVQIPLGYMQGMLARYRKEETISSVDVALHSSKILSSQRSYNWSFYGQIRGRKERGHAVEVFSQWQNYSSGDGITAAEVFEKYKEAKFVLSGRGQLNLDCFRIYEAIIAGALPVLVASQREYEDSFSFEGYVPPLVHAESYEEALELCQRMTDRQIDDRRHRVVSWYVQRIRYIRHRIDHAIFGKTNEIHYHHRDSNDNKGHLHFHIKENE